MSPPSPTRGNYCVRSQLSSVVSAVLRNTPRAVSREMMYAKPPPLRFISAAVAAFCRGTSIASTIAPYVFHDGNLDLRSVSHRRTAPASAAIRPGFFRSSSRLPVVARVLSPLPSLLRFPNAICGFGERAGKVDADAVASPGLFNELMGEVCVTTLSEEG